MTTPPVVSTDWLQQHLSDPGLRIIDNGGSPEAYLRGHVPGAVLAPCHPYLKHFDPRGERTQHVMGRDDFGTLCHGLGLRRGQHIVVCDDRHGLYAARFRAVARHYGVVNVSILDGGMRAWVAESRPLEVAVPAPRTGTDFGLQPLLGGLVGLQDLRAALADDVVQIWDTRRSAEFDGSEETDNLRRGHVPGARHLAWTDLLNGDDEDGQVARLRPLAELRALVEELGLRRDRPVVTYCQSGIRAAYAQLVLELLGYPDVRLYDASMGEWANLPDTPLA